LCGHGGGDFWGRLVGQFELEPVEEQRQFGFGLGIAGQLQLAAVGSGDVDVDHLNGGEFLEQTARGQARRQSLQAMANGDVETIGEKGDEDVSFDALRLLVMDRTDGEIALQVSKRFLDIPL
jgi:hypothetical protein